MRAKGIIYSVCAIRMCDGKIRKWAAAATAADVWNGMKTEVVRSKMSTMPMGKLMEWIWS